MFGWWKELLEIRYEFRERKLRIQEEQVSKQHVCQTCEVLKVALERANYEKEQLLKELLKPEEVSKIEPPVEMTKPRQVPWMVRRQMIEAEDREKARILRDAPKPETTEDLEKELDIASATRETTTVRN